MSGLAGFIRRNIVMVTTLPILVVMHVGWYSLQFNADYMEQTGDVRFFGVSFGSREAKAKEAAEKKAAEK